MCLASIIKRIPAIVSIVTAGLAGAAIFGIALAQQSNQEPPRVPAAAMFPTISFQGRINQDGAPFNGDGFFKFAIVDPLNDDALCWTNDGSEPDIPYEPKTPVRLPVNNGLFTVLLGVDGLENMTPLTADVFSRLERRLRVWFSPDDGVYEPLTPDMRLGWSPYAFYADLLDGQHGTYYRNASNINAGTLNQNYIDAAIARKSDIVAAGYISQTAADARYARVIPTTQQIAMLKWYTAISTTQSNSGVGINPYGIAFDGANMWVANNGTNNVSVLRASDGYRVMMRTVGANPYGIAYDGVNMWVVNSNSRNVSVLRASDGAQIMTPTVGGMPHEIAFDGVNMWVTNYTSATVSVLRASDGYNVMTPTVGANPFGIAFDGANMWVANFGSNSVSVLRASDGFHVMTTTLNLPSAALFDGVHVWVSLRGLGSVTALRLSDAAQEITTGVGTWPEGMAFDGANIWVVNRTANTVSVVRASDGALVKTIPADLKPTRIAFDGAYMWITNYDSNTVSKR